MRRRRLGSTGLQVSEVCLGAMTFGAAAPRDEAARILDVFTDHGGDFIDTAVNYAGGASEEVLGELLHGRRDRYVLATKYSGLLAADDVRSGGNSARSLRLSLETSLRRLRTDHVDLYWVHFWDQVTPLEEIVRALDDAVTSGKVLYVGISNTPAWAVARAATQAELQDRARFQAIQVEYNLTERSVERELVPMSRALGMSVVAWGPLAGGLLTGKYALAPTDQQVRLQSGDRRFSPRNQSLVDELLTISRELGASPAAIAFKWLLDRPARPIPIAGARNAPQLQEQLAGLDLQLPDDLRERLDRASEIPLGYPHDFIERLLMNRRF
ncbi:MAG: aldo/keto reductase [Phenylobacterium sp.]|uniref:aldo/keto reductase n=1 Tax=Phenylobacterium sp. TaxID=1871053 RepID=UPI00181E2054|nr:aldo/keto reductase [Phenylobacterium sp.]MBA4793665.1 aldo/keto reductase [Phenylobacterium sp.]